MSEETKPVETTTNNPEEAVAKVAEMEDSTNHPQQDLKAAEEKTSKNNGPSVENLLEYGFESVIEMTDDNFASMFEEKVLDIKEDELVQGKIVNITKDEVHVDIGFKSLGVVPRAELLNAESYEVGELVDVYVEKIEDNQGRLILSRRRADFMRIWEDIMNHYDNQTVTKVHILRRIKGGMVVDLNGIEAFLPGSQIDVRPVRDFDAWVGKDIDVKVVKVNHPSENVVVSHKVLLEEALAEQRGEIMSKLEKGLVLEGVVKAISDFGVFVDLGGVDGLVHITDLSWGRVTHPTEVVELDQEVKVVILDFDKEKRRISLGMKQLTPHPWESIGDKYVEGAKVNGKVVSLTDYGAFIEIEKGIEGLIHISEMSWTQHIKHPSQMVSMGQEIEAIVLQIDKDSKKLALGMKQLEPDPWEELLKKYPIGSNHHGVVRNLTNFGVFIELEPGVDGLIHISDLSWTKKIRHPGEFVKKGDEIDCTVLSIDSEQRRIALGHKQISENPWDFFENQYAVGKEADAKIERIIDKGVIVELPEGVDGFVPVSQLSFAPVDEISTYFKIGDELPLKVVEFDKESKKIVLSVVERLRNQEEDIINAFNAKHPVPNADKFINTPPEYDSSQGILPEEEFLGE
ncbi:30S ribosomal protein S1 [Candidatus Kapabacteria bacterium]|nr:30S ribosomal protein S1 [Candidatus Kapabacteria bacterium]